MNLAYKYPIIFWNCACLISDSGGNEGEEDDEIEDEETTWDETVYVSTVDFEEDDEDEDEDDDVAEDTVEIKDKKKKKKNRANNYGKLAEAIGKMKMEGINVTSPNINSSTYTFYPDVENSTIRFGMSGIVKVGKEIVKNIVDNRPYSSVEDFLRKVKVNKPQMVNLIKAGAFDGFGDRIEIMASYLREVSKPKKRITLQNMKMLIDFNLIPDIYNLQRRVYNFNKYLKKQKINNYYYGLDNIAFSFFEKHFNIDELENGETESGFKIKQAKWDKHYQFHMDVIRPYVKSHSQELLEKVNERLFQDLWNKYAEGSLSKWEMDSVSCYFHEHELNNLHEESENCVDFFKLPEEPIIDRFIPMKGKQIPLFKIERIMGTILDKNKDKKTITLLTTTGVVKVRIYGEVFNHYNRQISEKGVDGKKHVIEKSWLSRGNKVIVTGVRRGSDFCAKKYKNTPYHLVTKITKVNEYDVETIGERMEV